MAPQMSPIRLGMIGCGLISHAHGRAAEKSGENVRFVSCASRTAENAAAWARAYGCDSFYTDHREMLRNEELDGVVIATWPVLHRAQIEDSMDAGVRFILCEKALVTTGNDALALWIAAQETGTTIMEAFVYRHHDAIAKLDALVASGELGTIDNVHGVFHMFDAETGEAGQNWRQQASAGGGVLYDFICYPVDAANKIIGALPERVFAMGSESAKYNITDRLYAQIDYRGGCVASVGSSRKASFCQSLQVAGSDAILDLPVAWSIIGDVTLTKTASPAFLVRDEVEYFLPQSDAHDGRLIDFPVFTRQLKNFARTIRGTAQPAISMEESVINAFTLEAIGRSYRLKQPVSVEIPKSMINAGHRR